MAVATFPPVQKKAYDAATNTPGNNLTRNFLLEFAGARELTQITVEAEVWQLDFSVRLKGIDERERLSNRDIYGRSSFFASSFLCVDTGGGYALLPGTAYVEGIRADITENMPVVPVSLPCDVYIDVSMQASGSDVVTVISPFTSPAGANPPPADYDSPAPVKVRHYLERVSSIDAMGMLTDRRPLGLAGDAMADVPTQDDLVAVMDVAAQNLSTHAGQTSAHGATAAPEANRMMLRDANGRAKVAPPKVADDIARLAEVAAAQAAASNLANATGVLPVAKGGTGAGTVHQMIQTMYNVAGSKPSPEYFLTFGPEGRNSGHTSLAQLKTALGVVPIAQGGTGAADRNAAVANLFHSYEVFSPDIIYTRDSANATTVGFTTLARLKTALGVGYSWVAAWNGWYKFPGGMIIQWGRFVPPASDGSVHVAFPITFPSYAINLQITDNITADGGIAGDLITRPIGAFDVSGFDAYGTDTGGMRTPAQWAYYIAIGV